MKYNKLKQASNSRSFFEGARVRGAATQEFQFTCLEFLWRVRRDGDIVLTLFPVCSSICRVAVLSAPLFAFPFPKLWKLAAAPNPASSIQKVSRKMIDIQTSMFGGAVSSSEKNQKGAAFREAHGCEFALKYFEYFKRVNKSYATKKTLETAHSMMIQPNQVHWFLRNCICSVWVGKRLSLIGEDYAREQGTRWSPPECCDM